MNIKINKKSFIHQTLILIAAWSSFIKMAVNEQIHDILAVISVAFGCILFVYAACKLKIPQKIFIIWIIFVLFGFINIIFVGNLYITLFASIMLSYFPISLNLAYAPKLHLNLWKINYIIVGLYLIYRMANSPDGILLFHNLSRNNLSVLLLAWLIIYAVASKKNNREIPLWSISFYCFCCIFAVGRFGIFVASIIFLEFWIYGYFYKSHHKLRVQPRFFIGVSGVILAILIFYNFRRLLLGKVFSRFAEIGFTGIEDRLGMSIDYFREWNTLKSIILGADRTNIPSIVIRSGNPHNSYVFSHMYFGIIGLSFLVFGAVITTIYFYKTKQFEMMILAFGYFLRIFSDSVYPGSFGGDVAYWLFIFFVLWHSRINNFNFKT